MELSWEEKLCNWPFQLRKENTNIKAALPASGNIKINRWTLWPEHASNRNGKAMQSCAKKQHQLTLCWEAWTSFHLHMKCCKNLYHSGWGTEMKVKIVTLSNIFLYSFTGEKFASGLSQSTCCTIKLFSISVLFLNVLILTHFTED